MPDLDFRYDQAIIRAAMLDAQAKWLNEADLAETLTLRSVARVIADAFDQEAAKYKTKETFNEHGESGDFKLGAAPEVPSSGAAGGTEG